MRLLICAQAVDQNDKELSFFLSWLRELSKHFGSITVLSLRVGEYDLPDSVRVLPLGGSRLGRAASLLKYSFLLRRKYDAVFVHQGQEFVLVAGLLWLLMCRPVYLWRNHYAGSLLTDIAASFCSKVFCTSRYSYTAKFKKTMMMPVGIDTGTFRPVSGVERKPRSVLFLARMSPSKRAEMLIDALKILKRDGVEFIVTIVGSPLPKDAAYYRALVVSASELGSNVRFMPGVPNTETPVLYSAHEVFVNCSRSGMYDKTIFEAAACGAIPLAMSEDWRGGAGDTLYFSNAEDLAGKLTTVLSGRAPVAKEKIKAIVDSNSLGTLMRRLYTAMV